jgi:hypothetical protein
MEAVAMSVVDQMKNQTQLAEYLQMEPLITLKEETIGADSA